MMMRVMQVRHMRMVMCRCRVPVWMAMRPCGQRIVEMVVMPVVMAMRVFVFQRQM